MPELADVLGRVTAVEKDLRAIEIEQGRAEERDKNFGDLLKKLEEQQVWLLRMTFSTVVGVLVSIILSFLKAKP